MVDSIDINTLSTTDKQILDSLLPLAHDAAHDSLRIKIISDITENTWSIRVWPKYNQLTYDIAVKNLEIYPGNRTFLKYKGYAINNFGYYHKEIENATLALKNYMAALEIAEEIDDDQLKAMSLNNLGYIYHKMLSAPAKALDYYQKAIALDKKNNDQKSYAIRLANIGDIYLNQGDTTKGYNTYHESLKIREEIKDLEGIARASSDLAQLYFSTKQLDSCQKYSLKALELVEMVGYERGIAQNKLMLGRVQGELGNTDSMLTLLNQTIILDEQIANTSGVGDAYLFIGEHYAKKKNYDQALTYIHKAHDLFKGHSFPINLLHSTSALSKTYEEIGEYKKALSYYKENHKIEMELNNQEIEKRIMRQTLQAEFDQKEAEIENQMVIARQKERNKNIVLTVSLVSLLVVLGLLVYLYNRFKLIRDQKDLILKQQTLLEYKNKDLKVKNKQVSDSINYARYIAQTIYPNPNDLQNVFKDFFVYFRPKDIVSGDFYWAHPVDENNIILVVADCTGHGVPGAMLSIICSSILDQVVIQNNILQPSYILDQFYEELISKITRHSKSDKVNDGVEMTVLRYDKLNNEVFLSASYHKAYLVENGTLKEYAGDKVQIKRENFVSGEEFTSYRINPKKGSMLYMFSDGFVDQKGGPKNKKYFYAPFRKFLTSIAELPMKEQKETIDSEMKSWKDMNEQYDDMLIFGIKF